MVAKMGRYGKFLSCSAYPKCKNIKNLDKDGNVIERMEKAVAEESGVKCDKCDAPMAVKNGRFGKFLSCTAYPKCKNIKNLDGDGNIIERPAGRAKEKAAGKEQGDKGTEKVEKTEKAPLELTDTKCDKCGSPMAVKNGRYGKFLSCSAYPKCKNIMNLRDPSEPVILCPDCGKELRKLHNKRGNPFYGCSGYPDCTYVKDADGDKKE